MTRKERILERLREMGAEPKRSLGQNFLISDTVVDRILFVVKTEKFDQLVEVGPGLGALTEDLLSLNKPITLLELDRNFVEYWRSRGQTVVEGDALQIDWRTLNLPAGTLFVSNLPYQISSSLVIERSLEPAGVTRMILMFQKEVAQRLAARAATKEYGLLTVIAQAFWEIATVCEAGPRDFFPPPKVASRVLHFKLKPSPVADAAGFLNFMKAAFSHRRKLLAKNLEGFLGPDGKARLGEAFAAQGLLPTARAEELTPAAHVKLYLALRGPSA